MDYYNELQKNPIEEFEGYEPKRDPGRDYKLLEELRIALSIPSRLKELMSVSKKSFRRYVIFIGLLASIIVYLIPSAANIAGFGGFRHLFLEKIPAFKYENGSLKAEKKFDMMISGYHIYIDTDQEEVEPSTLPSNGMYLTFGSKYVNFALVEKSAVNDFSTTLYKMDNSGFFNEGMSNQQFAEASGGFYISIIVISIISALGMIIKYLFLAFIYTVILLIPYKIAIKNIYMDEAFKISFYAQTIGILISCINTSLGSILPQMLVSVVGIFITFRLIKYTLSYDKNEEI